MSITHSYLETTGYKPLTTEVSKAEIAINLVDRIMYTKDHLGNIVSLSFDQSGILYQTDIGVSVQAYNANYVVDASYVHTDNNYTGTEKTKVGHLTVTAPVNLDTLSSNSHTHANKTILDNTTASFVATQETKLAGIEALAEVNNISDANASSLTSGIDTTLHIHASDRARANHTGTQTLSTISDAGTAAGKNTGTTNGTVPLINANNQIDSSLIPASAITNTFVVINEAEQLALDASEGDVAVRTDESKTYIHNGGVLGTMADWTWMATPTDAVTSVAGKTGVVTLVATDIGDFTSAVTSHSDVAANTAARHTHSNKTILDAITASYTTAEESKLAGIEDSANNYSLPIATTVIGGVRSGTDIAIAGDGQMSVVDDSHNHIISNVDGLQTALDGKLPITHDIILTLNGDVAGSATMVNMGNTTITVAVVDDSHNHVISNIDNLQTTLDVKAPLDHSHIGSLLTGEPL